MKRSSSCACLVEHADGRVARAGDLARDVEQLAQDRLDVDLGDEQPAPGIDEAPQAGLVERRLGHGSRVETTDRGCGAAPISVQESADVIPSVRVEHGGHAPAHRRSSRPGRDHRRGLAARSRPPRMAGDRARPRGPGRLPGGRARRVRAGRRRRAQRGASRRCRSGQGARGAGRAPRRRPPPRASPSRSSSRSTRAARRAGRGGQEVQGRRPPPRHEGLQGPPADGDLELRDQRQDAPRDRRVRPDGRHRGRHRRLHARQRLDEGDEGHDAALDGLPLRRGQPRQALRRPRSRQVDALPLRGRAPGRLHVPLRDPAGADAHGHGHGRDVRGQAEEPGSGRQGAVGDPAGVLPRQARPGRRHGQDGRPRSRT